MRVSGFTILRDAVRFGYPFVPSIRSLLPLVDELIVNVGDCSDNTLEVLRSIDSDKITIFQTPWDPEMRKAGEVLAYQTNLALDRCTGDWCFYLQADEVLHEADYEPIRQAMHRHLHRTQIEGLRFKYLHFRGDYSIRDPLGYRSQIRIVRNDPNIRSVGDACGFGKWGRRLQGVRCGARVFHYGYVRPPKVMGAKSRQFAQFYVFDKAGRQIRERDESPLAEAQDFSYDMRCCLPYRGPHPEVMAETIAAKNWETPNYEPIPLWRNRYWWRGRLKKALPQLFREKSIVPTPTQPQETDPQSQTIPIGSRRSGAEKDADTQRSSKAA